MCNYCYENLGQRFLQKQGARMVEQLSGKWTYRSFRNVTDLVAGDANKALGLIFGEGIYTFELASPAALVGTFDMGGGFVLDLKGTVRPGTEDAPTTLEIFGTGRAGTPTDGWEYDYRAFIAYQWPNGVNQRPALVGSVIRAKPHNGGAAGLVASFIAVRQL
jgi:hypothetical protein